MVMDNINVSCSYISEKISKIRWIPEAQDHLVEKFLTGSWDSSQNSLNLWKFTQNQYAYDESEFVPTCIGKFLLKDGSGITGMEFINQNNVAISTTQGYISILNVKHDSELGSITEKRCSGYIHKLNNNEKMPCTGISIFEQNIASVGEDGRLNILGGNDLSIIKSFDNADSCTLTTVSYLNHNEILTGNRMGVLKMFDTRSEENPITTFASTSEDEKKSNYVSSIEYHPTQKHIILVGSEEGSITVWDLRQINYPASYLSAHTSAITELHFHRTQPNKLFTASENGELWQWNQNGIHQINDPTGTTATLAGSSTQDVMITNEFDNTTMNPWLNGERAKNKINVTALITGVNKAINSFDVIGSKLICGCDNAAIYYIENLF